ncbi:hypothetical protein LTS16_010713 [Friedmanniomyces endolithicus]|nr:hypothetical protein LTS01_021913 [Friedmanniomyces endolithicus]KAK1039949.1 hypothetical protein LTS16_010713 [Friedmanniomyces endolithicus]
MAPSGQPQGSHMPTLTYPERLRTFQDFWDDNEATARQLAAIGHVYDRPPLEALEEGSRCISCSQFVQRVWSVRILEGPMGSPNSHLDCFEDFQFHHTGCIHLQVRIPLEAQAIFSPLRSSGNGVADTEDWRKASRTPHQQTNRQQQVQTSSLFTLPVELRLQIYALVLPQLDDVTEISSLKANRPRIAAMFDRKPRLRDPTKTNLLRACQAIHSEALDLLYSKSTFTFDSCKTLYLFLRHIGVHGRGVLRSIDIVCGSREDAIALSLLATCYELKRIVLRLTRARLVFPRASLWLTDGVAALLALRGLQEVRVGNGSGCVKHIGPHCLGRVLVSLGRRDAEVVERELERPRGEEGGVSMTRGGREK